MKKERGLTLIELAVVLIVLGILLGIGAGVLSVLIKRIKFNESREIVNAAVEGIVGFSASSGRLPTDAELGSVIRTLKDSYGKDLAYVYDQDLTASSPYGLCGLTSTNLRVRVCGDSACSTVIQTIDNVAFIVISGNGNYNNQTSGTQGVNTLTTIDVFEFGVNVDNYSGDINRVEPYDDIVKWVTLHEIQTAQGCEALTITSPATLPEATEDEPYSYQLQAKGGRPPYTWSGSVGSGLTLNSDGTITGTVNTNTGTSTGEVPGCSTTITFTATVTDSAGQSQSQTFTIPVRARRVEIITNTLPDAYEGTPYTADIDAIGGSGTYSFSVVSGSLPAGLSLNSSTGQITGTPPTDSGCSEGVSNFGVQVSSCTTTTKGFSITVRDPDCGGGGGGGGGGGLSCSLSANPSSINPGDTTTLIYSINGGPADGVFNPSSGTCTSFTNSTSGSCVTGPLSCTTTFTLSISNGSSSAFCSTTVTVNNPSLQITPPSGTVFNFTVGTPVGVTMGISGGSPPYTNTLCYAGTCSSLGISFSCSSSGATISGTPTKSGSCNVQASWQDSCGQTITASYTINVECGTYNVVIIQTSYFGDDYVDAILINGSCRSLGPSRGYSQFTANGDQTIKLYQRRCFGSPLHQYQLSTIDTDGDCNVYISCNGDVDDCRVYNSPTNYCPRAGFRLSGNAEGIRINGGTCRDRFTSTWAPATIEVFTNDNCSPGSYQCTYNFDGTFPNSVDTDEDCDVRIYENCTLSNL